MIGIFFKDGSYAEVEGTSARLESDNHLVCWGPGRTVLARIPTGDILSYGRAGVTRDLVEETGATVAELRLDEVAG